MEKGTTVIFLDYFESLDKAVPLLLRVSAGLRSKPVIVSSNFDTALLTASSLGSKVIYFDDLISRNDYEFMDNYILNLVQNWYLWLKPIDGITKYKEIQLGSLLEERAQLFFTSDIKNVEIILKIADRFHPDKIILIGEKEVFKNLAEFIRTEMNISTLFVKSITEPYSLMKLIKRVRNCIPEVASNILDGLMRVILLRKKENNGIFLDSRLYFELKSLKKNFNPYLYIVQKGLRIRMRLVKDGKIPFVPVLIGKVLRWSPSGFSPSRKYWELVKNSDEFKKKFKYRNISIWCIVDKFIREAVLYDFQQLNRDIVFLEELYKNIRPKLVIVRESVRAPERMIVVVAKSAGIRTLVIQHGILTERNIFTRLHSDKIALWGKAGADWYGAYGNDVSKCIITGKPAHDTLYPKSDNCKKEAEDTLLKIGADPAKKTILFIGSFFKNIRYQMYSVYYSQDSEYIALSSVLNIMDQFSDKQLIVKIHPFDPVDINSFYKNSGLKSHTNAFVAKNVNIIPLIINSALVVTSFFSSAALDAVIFGKPVIALNFYKREDLVPFAQRGVALGVNEAGQLYQAVKQIFEDKKLIDRLASDRESFIYDYAYKIDGGSTERVIDLIKQLCNKPNISGAKEIRKQNLRLGPKNRYKNEYIVN